MPNVDTVWSRMKSLEGEQFETKTGLPFTFEISGDIFHPSRTRYNISKADLGKALDLVPLEGPGLVSQLVRGPAYIWAVLHDERIRNGEW